MNITTSPDITNLEVSVTWDISNSTPQILLTNLSTGSGLANCSWAFVATSPTGTFIHDGNISSPDIVGNWATYTLNDAWPRPFNSIEWSGAPYSFYVICKDSQGNIFTAPTQTAIICRPNGNTQSSKNTYGIASANVTVMCQQARVYFEDTTNSSYKGDSGTQVGSVLKVVYPIDETGNIPPSFSMADFVTTLVPISYSSDNYQFWQYSIYDYLLSVDTYVRIRYQLVQTFSVWCNIDLQPLLCEFNALIDSVQNGTCAEVNDAQQKINLISPKLTMAMMGIMQPLLGINVSDVVEQIQKIGEFDCDCCSAPSGIIPQTSSIVDGYNFSINSVCGDIAGTVTTNGYNIAFNLQDISYIVTIASNSPSGTDAFKIETITNGCQKTYALNIDGSQLAEDILNIIKSDSALVNLFNSIVNVNVGNFSLLVDGKCIFSNTDSCDYEFDLSNIPLSTTYAILTSIKVGSISHTLNSAFNETNLSSLQSYLNSLGYGTFSVGSSSPSTGDVQITSTSNTNDLQSMTYSVAGINYIANFSRTCTGYTQVSANQVVQSLIDYLCGITDAEIVTSENYEICYNDPNTGAATTVTINSGTALTTFISTLLARGCDTVNWITKIGANTCSSIQSLFPVNTTSSVTASDYFLQTKGSGQYCSRGYVVDTITQVLKLGIFNNDFMTAFCAAVVACQGGSPCAPFNTFYLDTPYSSPTDDTMDIVVYFDLPAAASFTLRYARIDNTNNPSYITVPNILSSPYTISGLNKGQYFVGLTPVYADGRKCSESTLNTDACTGINAFNAVLGGSPIDEFDITYNCSASVPDVRVNISYPNGGSWSQIYSNTGTPITVPLPTGVFGSFSLTMQPVCNVDTGWYGAPTSPVVLTVTDPSVTTTNYTLSAAYNFSIDSVSGVGVPSLPATGTNGTQKGTQTGMSGTYSVVLSGTVVTTTKLDAIVNGVVVWCGAVGAAGTFFPVISAGASDTVVIAVDSGSC